MLQPPLTLTLSRMGGEGTIVDRVSAVAFLARRHALSNMGLHVHHTAYDGAYLALAEALQAPLVTRDARLAASRGHRAQIELL